MTSPWMEEMPKPGDALRLDGDEYLIERVDVPTGQVHFRKPRDLAPGSHYARKGYMLLVSFQRGTALAWADVVAQEAFAVSAQFPQRAAWALEAMRRLLAKYRDHTGAYWWVPGRVLPRMDGQTLELPAFGGQ